MCDIILFIFGLFAVITGKFYLTRKLIVQGMAARIVGILLMLPMPINFAVGVAFKHTQPPVNHHWPDKYAQDIGTIISALSTIISVLCLVVGIIISICAAKIDLDKSDFRNDGLGNSEAERQRSLNQPPLSDDDRFQAGR
jgi:hypothetical protein